MNERLIAGVFVHPQEWKMNWTDKRTRILPLAIWIWASDFSEVLMVVNGHAWGEKHGRILFSSQISFCTSHFSPIPHLLDPSHPAAILKTKSYFFVTKKFFFIWTLKINFFLAIFFDRVVRQHTFKSSSKQFFDGGPWNMYLPWGENCVRSPKHQRDFSPRRILTQHSVQEFKTNNHNIVLLCMPVHSMRRVVTTREASPRRRRECCRRSEGTTTFQTATDSAYFGTSPGNGQKSTRKTRGGDVPNGSFNTRDQKRPISKPTLLLSENLVCCYTVHWWNNLIIILAGKHTTKTWSENFVKNEPPRSMTTLGNHAMPLGDSCGL